MTNLDLLKPVITEKSMRLAQSGQFTFNVTLSATKNSVASAISNLFKVDVVNVNIIKLKAKTRRSGKRRLPSLSPSKKKAIVTLKSGQMIEYFELPKEKSKKNKKPASTAKRGE